MSKARNLLELVRIPGIFTAQADILAGFFLAGAAMQRIPAFLCLLLASSCFYSAGMALNDAFDAAIDARERPARPIPSGRIEKKTAFWIGFGLLAAGLLFSRLAGFSSFVIGCLLAAAIVTYDGGIKHLRWWGPINMGTCRYFNLLLGISAGSLAWTSPLIPLLTGIHIFGVTALSRHEAEGHDQRGIVICSATLIAVPLLYCTFWLTGVLPNKMGMYLCSIWAISLLVLMARLAVKPSPANTQLTVKWLLMGLVILDGVIVAGLQPWIWGLIVWLMVFPVVAISRKFYVT